MLWKYYDSICHFIFFILCFFFLLFFFPPHTYTHVSPSSTFLLYFPLIPEPPSLSFSSSLAIFFSVRTKVFLFPINSKARSPFFFFLLSHRHRMIGLKSSGVQADRFLPLLFFIFLSNTLSILINYYKN